MNQTNDKGPWAASSRVLALVEEHEKKLKSAPPNDSAHLDYVLIDGSASMKPKWWNFLSAADILLEDVKRAGIQSRIIAHVFSEFNIEMVQRDGPIATEAPLVGDSSTQAVSSSFGCTPLYDAINVMGRRLQVMNPEKASVLVVTDGLDNMSTTSAVQARAVLDWLRSKGWQITFIGCDFDNSRQASELGLNAQNAIGVRSEKLGEAMKAFAAKRIRYANSDSEIEFSEEERQKFGGYLGKS